MITKDSKPMMSDGEIAIIDNILSDLRPKHCLEWGSGASSIYFPKKHKFTKWLAVEHNGNWVKKIAEYLPDNSTVIWTPEDNWYEDCVKHSRIFNFVLVDGIHKRRARCLEIAKDIISSNGVILLHDSGRADYKELIKKYNGKILCEGEQPFNGYYKHRGLAEFRK